MARQRGAGHERQALTSEVIDDHQHPEAAAVREQVGDEVEAPALVEPLRQGHWRPRAQRSLAPAATTHGQALLAVEPEELLVVDLLPLSPQQDQESPIAEPPPQARQIAQALA